MSNLIEVSTGTGVVEVQAETLIGAFNEEMIEDTVTAFLNARTLTAGAGLTGGGTLAADRTFNVATADNNHIVVNADSIDTGIHVPLTNAANVFTAFNTFQGTGHALSAGSLATFYSGLFPAAGNLFGISIDKTGYETCYLGINRNTAYAEVPANAVYLSTFKPDGQISIGRGGNLGDISYSDILVTSTGMVTIPRGVRLATAALLTNATDGFTYIPTCAGTPTGTPTAQTGTVPIVYDTSANRLYVHNGGAWKSVPLS